MSNHQKKHSVNKTILEEFDELLLKNRLGFASDEDNCRLIELMATDEVRQRYEDTKETYPDVKFNIECKPEAQKPEPQKPKRRVPWLAISLAFSGILIAVTFALTFAFGLYFFTKSLNTTYKPEHGFYDKPLKDVIEKAGKHYGKTILLDQPGIGDIPASGGLDNVPLDDFLYNLTIPHKLKYYTDTSGVIHISY